MSDMATAVGQLIGFSLQPKLAAARNEEYRELVARYRNDSEFQDAVVGTLSGMGLEVLTSHPLQGLVLAASAHGSPFRFRLGDFSANMKTEDRHRYALVFLAIAAASYPRAEALDDENGPLQQVSVSEVVRLLNQLAARVAEDRAAEHDDDPLKDKPLSRRLYQAVQSWPDTTQTKDDRHNSRLKSGMVSRALRWLAENGCADEVDTHARLYRMRGRFRVLVKDATAAIMDDLGAASIGEALAMVRSMAEKESESAGLAKG